MAIRRLSALTADKLAHASRDAGRLPCLAEVSDWLPLMMEHQIHKHNVARGCCYRPGGLSACHEFRQLSFAHDHAGLAVLRIFPANRMVSPSTVSQPSEAISLLRQPARKLNTQKSLNCGDRCRHTSRNCASSKNPVLVFPFSDKCRMTGTLEKCPRVIAKA